jgi:hypothetical protein
VYCRFEDLQGTYLLATSCVLRSSLDVADAAGVSIIDYLSEFHIQTHNDNSDAS